MSSSKGSSHNKGKGSGGFRDASYNLVGMIADDMKKNPGRYKAKHGGYETTTFADLDDDYGYNKKDKKKRK